jgi:hypothetical protein
MAADPARTRRVTRPMIAAFLAIPLAIAVGAAWVARSLLSQSPCRNEVRAERVAPDGEHRAVAFLRSCGESAPASTNVSIVRAGKELPNRGGNVLELDGEAMVTAEWRGGDELVLHVQRGASISRTDSEAYGVRVRVEAN